MKNEYPSDIANLKRVVVHFPGPETQKVLTVASGDHPFLVNDYLAQDALSEHANFTRLLKQNHIEVLELLDLLDEAIRIAKQNGHLIEWLSNIFPKIDLQHLDLGIITAESLLGGADRFFYGDDSVLGKFDPVFEPQKWMFYTRDFAAASPKGLILCNFFNSDRATEARLAHLMFHCSPSLSDIPITFDATDHNVFVQGGDIIVKDESTILLGINNFTEKAAAQRIAQELDIRVIAVSLPGSICFERKAYAFFTGLNLLFLHLDTVFTFVDHDKFLVVPYWFENEFKDADPLSDVLSSIKPIGEHPKSLSGLLRNVGWVTVFEPRTGKEINTKTKLVDFLVGEGLEPIFVGGEKPSKNHHKHVIECVLRETRFQAANVFAIKPGTVIAYEGNTRTLETLRSHKIDVLTFNAPSLVRWNGGPHCMTLPIERY